MVGFSVMSYFDRTIMSIAGPNIMREFGLSETKMGTVYSAFILSYALLMLPGGRWADRFGPRLVLCVMGIGAGLFTGLTALGGRPGLGTLIGVVPAFVLVRLGLGVFTAPLYPSCGKMNANWFLEAQRGLIWGLVAAGAGLGGAASPPLFSWMIARYGWRMSFWFVAATTAALTVVRRSRAGVARRPRSIERNGVRILPEIDGRGIDHGAGRWTDVEAGGQLAGGWRPERLDADIQLAAR